MREIFEKDAAKCVSITINDLVKEKGLKLKELLIDYQGKCFHRTMKLPDELLEEGRAAGSPQGRKRLCFPTAFSLPY